MIVPVIILAIHKVEQRKHPYARTHAWTHALMNTYIHIHTSIHKHTNMCTILVSLVIVYRPGLTIYCIWLKQLEPHLNCRTNSYQVQSTVHLLCNEEFRSRSWLIMHGVTVSINNAKILQLVIILSAFQGISTSISINNEPYFWTF